MGIYAQGTGSYERQEQLLKAWSPFIFLKERLCLNTSTVEIVTSRVCGTGNVFVVCVCVSLSVCLSVCLFVRAITFEPVEIETSILVWWYILTISRSSLSIKAIGSRSRSYHGNANLGTWTSV